MSDLISRQAAIESIRECAEAAHSMHDWDMEQGYLNAIECIEEEPSAQPERKKGKWIRHDEIKNVYGGICIECSECGEKYVVQHILDEKYCRNCGAKMDEEGKDD